MARSPVGAMALLSGLTHRQRQVVQAVRELVRKAAPTAEETILWRSLWYHRPSLGGRIKGAVCVITPRDDAVELGFIHGAALPDPHGLLKGKRKGKAKRALIIQTVAKIRKAQISKLVRAASEYDPAKRVTFIPPASVVR